MKKEVRGMLVLLSVIACLSLVVIYFNSNLTGKVIDENLSSIKYLESLEKPNCTENWTCPKWNECSEGFKSRVCYDSNMCHPLGEFYSYQSVKCGFFENPLNAAIFKFLMTILVIFILIPITKFIFKKNSLETKDKELINKK